MDLKKYIEDQYKFYSDQLESKNKHHRQELTFIRLLESEEGKYVPYYIRRLDIEKLRISQQTLDQKEKKSSVSHLGSFGERNDEGSHIIPRNSPEFFTELGLDSIFLDYKTGENIVIVSPNIHKAMELKFRSVEKPPYITIIPLELISDKFDHSEHGEGIQGYLNFLHHKKILVSIKDKDGNVLDANYTNNDKVLIVINPSEHTSRDCRLIKEEIKFAIKNNTIHNLEKGNLYWLIHSAWTIFYWGLGN